MNAIKKISNGFVFLMSCIFFILSSPITISGMILGWITGCFVIGFKSTYNLFKG